MRVVCQRHLGTTKTHAERYTLAQQRERGGTPVSGITQLLGHRSLQTTGLLLEAVGESPPTSADALARTLLGAG